jgi:hypothetical protein
MTMRENKLLMRLFQRPSSLSSGGTAHHLTIQSGGAFAVLGTVLSNVVGSSRRGRRPWRRPAPARWTPARWRTFGGALDHATVFSGAALSRCPGDTGHDIAVSSGGTLNVAGADPAAGQATSVPLLTTAALLVTRPNTSAVPPLETVRSCSAALDEGSACRG